MNSHRLRVFVSVAGHRSYTRAADELALTQPAVSIQVRQLESSLGMRLFERLGKQVHLTEAGESLLPYAKQVLGLMDEARGALEALSGLAGGRIRLGASTTIGIYLLPPSLRTFKEKYPDVRISLRIANTRQIEEGIALNELDLGFVGERPAGKELAVRPYLSDELVLIVRPGHPWAGRRWVDCRELSGGPVIVREPGSATRRAALEALQSKGVRPEPAMELEHPEAIKRAVEAGLGISLVSKFTVAEEVKSGRLKALKVRSVRLKRDLSIVHHKDKLLSPSMRAFLQAVEETPTR
ncbi:MAG: selenium metabolism-associated LysR family transcriptional regulator, partial [Nitrospinota bacterium]